MSDGTPRDPNRKPMPWETERPASAGLNDPAPGVPAPGDETPTADESSPSTAAPTPATEPGVTPADPGAAPATEIPSDPGAETTATPASPSPSTPAEPSAPLGVISAAPVGWAAPASRTPSQPPVGWPTPGTTTPPPALVGWAQPPSALVSVEGLGEGWAIAGTAARFMAYVFDSVVLVAASIAVTTALGAYDQTIPAVDRIGRAELATVISLVVGALYFIGQWGAAGQATLGMRLLQLRLVGARDGRTLPAGGLVIRWLALEGGVAIVNLLTSGSARTASLGQLVTFLYIVVLLASTIVHPLHQGLHDRWANSIVARRADAGNGPAIVGCLVLIAIFVIGPILLLAANADQLKDIIEEIGRSV